MLVCFKPTCYLILSHQVKMPGHPSASSFGELRREKEGTEGCGNIDPPPVYSFRFLYQFYYLLRDHTADFSLLQMGWLAA